MTSGSGGYDDGYRVTPCFWGTDPGSLVLRLESIVGSFANLSALDLGCGEGKNAVYLFERGASVKAVDVSQLALKNAELRWPSLASKIIWIEGDSREFRAPDSSFDVVLMYGLLHCFETEMQVSEQVHKAMSMTKSGGYHIVCTFNARSQDMSAHPGFNPCLLGHEFYSGLYSEWEILVCTDSDLHEVHPHNNLPHTHSMTRILARKR